MSDGRCPALTAGLAQQLSDGLNYGSTSALPGVIAAQLHRTAPDVQIIRAVGGGTGRAWLVLRRGAPFLLKWQPLTEGTRFQVVQTYLERLAGVGYATPQYVMVEETGDVEFSLQSFMPGVVSDELGATLVKDMEAANELQLGLGIVGTNSWRDRLIETTLHGAGQRPYNSLQKHSAAARNVWSAASGIALGASNASLPDGDLVHMDLHHRNILQVSGRLSAVIDWEGAETGDHIFDLYTLAFYSGVAGWSPHKRAGWIRELLNRAQADAGPLYLAHLAVRSVDWAITNESESDVQDWLDWSLRALRCLD